MKTMSAINDFLLQHDLRIARNPCVSPDFCLDWDEMFQSISAGDVFEYPKSRFVTAAGRWTLLESANGDCAWRLAASAKPLCGGQEMPDGSTVFPATWENLLTLKNQVQEHHKLSTIFPTISESLGRSTLGVGARFTTLHWPAVEWAMSALGIGLTANQNSVPRELVYDVNAMLENRLDTVPFPFIGAEVPEGHQGQSVEGMSHGAVISKLKTGFHQRGIAWSFNADHQPIGGKFDSREEALVQGCLLASYITFDLSPELAQGRLASRDEIPADVITAVRTRIAEAEIDLDVTAFDRLLITVWPALQKMKQRDQKYAEARAQTFTTNEGCAYLRELSIDELPGLTTPETTAIMLALCEVLEMPVNFVAPAFGFQKNAPYSDNEKLRGLIEKQWQVCQRFGVSIGFHSGSGKSAENYRVMGDVTGGALEIKTSGRYTYEMGVALSQSQDDSDQKLWSDWYQFTLEMAVAGAFSQEATERKMARDFVVISLASQQKETAVFDSEQRCRKALEELNPSPDLMVFFEYNFLYVLAAEGRAEKAGLGDHTAAGYHQRARFYSISDEARLLFSKRVAAYLVFLVEQTGLVAAAQCARVRDRLLACPSLEAMLNDIAP